MDKLSAPIEWTGVDKVNVSFNRYVGGPRPAAPKFFENVGWRNGGGAEYKIGGFGNWKKYVSDWFNAIFK